MAGKIKSITDPKLSLNILTPEEIQKIHQATLEVIETVGVRFPSARAMEIWSSFGADVDRKTGIVKARPDLIEEALKKRRRLTHWQRATQTKTC